MNAAAAADFISDTEGTNLIVEDEYSEVEQTIELPSDPTDLIKVTLAWTDPAPDTLPSGDLDDPLSVLVNDLDVWLTGPGGTFYPWTLDPNNPSLNAVQTGPNVVDNVEQVLIANPRQGLYTIHVGGTLDEAYESQLYSLLASVSDPNQWRLDAGGSYYDSAKWANNRVPGGVNAVANFLDNIEENSEVTVDSPVTVGTINFDNADYSYEIAGPATVTLETSAGDAEINVAEGDHTISAPLWAAGDLTVDTAEGTGLTIDTETGYSVLQGALTKDGTGSLTLGGSLIVLGAVDHNGGVLEAGPGVLAQPGGPITIGNATLEVAVEVAGSVPRQIVLAEGADPYTATIRAVGPAQLGDQGSNGFNFAGTLDVAHQNVTVLGLPGTLPVVTTALLGGGTLSGSPELNVAPVDGYIIGTGEVSGTVRLGDKDTETNAGGLYGQDEDHKLFLSGLVTGSADGYGNLTWGKGGDHRGWSPPYNITYGEEHPFETTFCIGGMEPGYIVEGAYGQDVSVPGDYTQFLIAGYEDDDGGAAPYQPSFFDHPVLQWDPDSPLSGWADLPPGELVLISTGEATFREWVGPPYGYHLVHRERGRITFGPDFLSDLQSQLDSINATLRDGMFIEILQMDEMANCESQLAAGLPFAPPTMNENPLILRIVPEPGTLVLLITGGLGLLAFAWRRRR